MSIRKAMVIMIIMREIVEGLMAITQRIVVNIRVVTKGPMAINSTSGNLMECQMVTS